MENVKPLIISEIFSTSFSIFADLDEAKRKSQIEKIHYIDTISRQLEKDISMSNLLEFIPNENGLLTASNKEINKALIGFEPEKVEKEIAEFEITDEIKETLLKLHNTTSIDEKDSLRSKISVAARNMEDYQNSYKAQMLEKQKLIRRYRSITIEKSEPFTKMLEEIKSEGTFNILEVCSDFMLFDTSEDIICTHKDVTNKIDIRVNFGKFKVRIGSNFDVTVLSDDPITFGGYIHPHVGSSGSLCLGNMSELFDAAIKDRDIKSLLDLTNQILVNYNNDAPYTSLYNYAVESKQIQPNGEVLKSEEELRNEVTSEEVTCPNCDTSFIAEITGGEFSGDCVECDEFFTENI